MREKIEIDDNGCWLWTAYVAPNGYGRLIVGSRIDGTRRCAVAHRVSFEHFVGPVPDGFELDHLCNVRRCVNPEHLQVVTHRENIVRSSNFIADHARQTRCVRGHEFTENNTRVYRGGRFCRACERDRSTARRQAA